MNTLLGKKVGMTQIFSEKGDCVPVTVVAMESCIPVLQKTKEKDGYNAVLIACGERKPKHTNKPLQGFYDKHKLKPARQLTEFRDETAEEDRLGKPLDTGMFSAGDLVSVVGTSKGKGFAGVMKRHNFAGKDAGHGTHESFRGGGSIGMHTYPGRVFKGKKMAGRMGGDRIQVKNLQVVQVDTDKNVLLIRGAVPGAAGGMVRVTQTRKAKE